MRSLEVELEAWVEQALVPHLLPLLLIRLCTACPAQVSVLIHGAFHTLTPKIFHQQVTDFPIHRRGEMLLAIEELDHLAW
jgi:hypothetical protein